MSDTAIMSPPGTNPAFSKKALSNAARFWFLVTIIGQWIFVAYILAYYGQALWGKGLAGLADTRLPNGYIEGNLLANLSVLAHVFPAAIIIFGGPLQLIPRIRAKWPTFHRWNGRLYVAMSVLACVAGIYMTWFREGGSLLGDIATKTGTTTAGVLVFIFAYLAVKNAVQQDFRAHRKWVLRLFMVVSAVWFIRLITFGWIIATGGIGIEWQTFTGPFVVFASYAQWLLPLLVLELYFWGQERAGPSGRLAVAGTLVTSTLLMAFGIFSVSIAMWIPSIF